MKKFLENIFIKNPYGAGVLTFLAASLISFLVGVFIKMFVLEIFLVSFSTIIPTIFTNLYKEIPSKIYQLKLIGTFTLIYFVINVSFLSFIQNDVPKLLLLSVVLIFTLIIFGFSYLLLKILLKNVSPN